MFRKIHYKTEEEIACIRESGQLVSKTLGELASHIRSGVTPLDLDKIAETYIRDHGATPAFLNYNGFPNTLCISVNDKVVHGIPNERPFQTGDIVSVDCGVKKDDYYGDQAYTFFVEEITDDMNRLLKTTKECLLKGIEHLNEGGRLGNVGFAIQEHAEENGYGVVRELVGHGIGRNIHEPPEVPNYGTRGKGKKIQNGLVVAIEPMINMGSHLIKQLDDGWTIVTADASPSAHYEHMVAVINGRTEVLTTFDYIEN